MLNAQRVVKAGVLWTTVAYAVCFFGVALFPDIRSWFMEFALHTRIDTGENVMNVGTFVAGLVIWDALAAFGFWLFAAIYNSVKE